MPPNSIAFLEKESKARPHISKHKMVLMKNSTDFAMGRRPKIKSEEFFISTFLGVEIIAKFVFETAKTSGAPDIGGATLEPPYLKNNLGCIAMPQRAQDLTYARSVVHVPCACRALIYAHHRARSLRPVCVHGELLSLIFSGT